ncbi:ABC transporter ATP-binding protein [Cryptosporangium arvum]|uniref:ABC-type cobalamin/Fe3+-siderophore transport system, ATPase component n=1 Tax=Cryptosporangium arvum DSM 44712 TaxID=927661 RepID=A0A010ZPD9_9ACTN|nr:ABC transporter ATP-binding protein [Cryptosporangium arvum]EXG80549.1 ABC-type cobalamin/Fe3+-siderophore transport system, ATPase component [Cryptosporangium arvum DSM 44712]
MSLRAESVSWAAGGRLIVDAVDLDAAPGSTVGLLGPNGSGKSTLLRVLAGLRRPSAGVVTLDDAPLSSLGRRGLARRLAVVEQHAVTDVDLTVRDVIALGRVPHRRGLSAPSAADSAAVLTAAARTGLTTHLDQEWRTLSGGERQRAQIARALAQEPRELLLDEPTNHLDIGHQLELLALVCALPVTSVVALHDLNLAAMFCDSVVLLHRGRAVAAGTPAQVLTRETIREVYGVSALVSTGADGRPTIHFARPPG